MEGIFIALLLFGCCITCVLVALRVLVITRQVPVPHGFGDPVPTGVELSVVNANSRLEVYHDALFPRERGEPSACVICIEDYAENDAVRVLWCGHHYHQACIDAWFAAHRTCPTCRQAIDEPVAMDAPANGEPREVVGDVPMLPV